MKLVRILLCFRAPAFRVLHQATVPVVLPESEVAPAQASRDSSEDYYLLGLDNERRGREREALLLFRFAYELDTSSLFLRDQLIRQYSERGHDAEALGLLKGRKKSLPAQPQRQTYSCSDPCKDGQHGHRGKGS